LWVRYLILRPRDSATAEALAKRTLTNLYSARPAWLDRAHRALDDAVFAAYGWSPTMTDEEILATLLAFHLERADRGGSVAAGDGDDGDAD
jgi:hypothetical protein